MRALFLALAALALAAALLVPSEYSYQTERKQQCRWCQAIRITEYRRVKSILPVFGFERDEVTGGKPDCKHWWQEHPDQTTSRAGGWQFRTAVIVLRIVLFGAAPVLLFCGLRRGGSAS